MTSETTPGGRPSADRPDDAAGSAHAPDAEPTVAGEQDQAERHGQADPQDQPDPHDQAAPHEKADPQDPRQTMLSEAIGGPRGLIDSGLPAIVFVIANAIGGLTPAIVAAVAVGVVLVIVRLYRKETLQQAIAGFFGVALAAVVAARTGHASGFFLPGILYQAVLAVMSVVSLVIGRPYVGYVLAAVDPKYAHWRSSTPLRRSMAVATVLWGLIFAARAVVQFVLYENDRVGWLATAKIAMGWPLFAVGLAVTYWLARRAHPDPEDGPGRQDGAAESAGTLRS